MPIKFGDYKSNRVLNQKGINVTVAMFFDGTCNNKNNTDARVHKLDSYRENRAHWYGGHSDKGDDSYENDYSNVARLWTKYENDEGKYIYSTYVEGIGTTDGKGDDTTGYALGSGKTGVPAKVKKGCEEMAKLADSACKSAKTNIINTLTVDVFGFSRGAAAARHFVHEITKAPYKAREQVLTNTKTGIVTRTYYDDMGNNSESIKEFPLGGYFGANLADNIEIGQIRIRFIGIFDTVASYATEFFIPPLTDKTPAAFTNDTAQLHLDAIRRAEKVVHLVAQDEVRANFPLTNINSAGDNGIQLQLPGVHSDVGGSYVWDENEIIERLMQVDHFWQKEKLEEEKKRLVSAGWYFEEQLTIHKMMGGDSWQYCLRGERCVVNTYSFIPLHMMAKFAKEYDTKNPIPINLDKLEGSVEKTTIEGNALLGRIKKRLYEYAFTENGQPLIAEEIAARLYLKSLHHNHTSISEERTIIDKRELQDLKKLRHEYLHQSAKYDRAALRTEPLGPRINNGKRERLIIAG